MVPSNFHAGQACKRIRMRKLKVNLLIVDRYILPKNVPLFHPSRTPAAALPSSGFCSRSSAAVRQHPQRASRAPVRASFLLFSDIPRTLLKFLEIPDLFVPHTRVNFSTASSITLPHPVVGAALLRGRLSPFLFGVSFSTGHSRSFRSASSTACARKKKNLTNLPTLCRNDYHILRKFEFRDVRKRSNIVDL